MNTLRINFLFVLNMEFFPRESIQIWNIEVSKSKRFDFTYFNNKSIQFFYVYMFLGSCFSCYVFGYFQTLPAKALEQTESFKSPILKVRSWNHRTADRRELKHVTDINHSVFYDSRSTITLLARTLNMILFLSFVQPRRSVRCQLEVQQTAQVYAGLCLSWLVHPWLTAPQCPIVHSVYAYSWGVVAYLAVQTIRKLEHVANSVPIQS